MKIRIEGAKNVPPGEYDVSFLRIESDGDDLVAVYTWTDPKPISVATLVNIPKGIRLIGESWHKLQYTHTDSSSNDIYKYVESRSDFVPSDEHEDFVNEILNLAPEHYDGDDTPEAIALRFVKDLVWARDEAARILDRIVDLSEHDELTAEAARSSEAIRERTKTERE